jgi:hypothetical protein
MHPTHLKQLEQYKKDATKAIMEGDYSLVKDMKCECKEKTCTKNCERKHTHKGYSCEVCELEETNSMTLNNKSDDEVLKNGLVGKLAGYNVHGKTYDTEGNLIPCATPHSEDCFCCCESLFGGVLPEEKKHKSFEEEFVQQDGLLNISKYDHDRVKNFIIKYAEDRVSEEREKLRVRIECEVVNPLLDNNEKFFIIEMIDTLRSILKE